MQHCSRTALLTPLMAGVLFTVSATTTRAQDTPSTPTRAATSSTSVDQLQPGVWAVASDNGTWGGGSMGTTHQTEDTYWIEKRIDVPAALLAKAREARLRVYMLVRDYSAIGTKGKEDNGLDESFELAVNGKGQTFRDDDPRLPAMTPTRPSLEWQWHDFVIPTDQLKAGTNTFLFRKLPTGKTHNDDYLYIGIDNSMPGGNSRMSPDGGKTWSTRRLNMVDAQGEYMIRLLLSDREFKTTARWTPQGLTDPRKLIGYAPTGTSVPTGTSTTEYEAEFDSSQIDTGEPFSATLSYQGTTPPTVKWFDEDDKPLTANLEASNGELTYKFPPSRRVPGRVTATGTAVTALNIDYTARIPTPDSFRIDMAPHVVAPRGKATGRAPAARRTANGFVLENALFQATFTTQPKLRLTTLRHELLQKNVIAHPNLTRLFLIEIDGKRFGADDWQVRGVRPLNAPKKGFAVQLALPQYNLSAQFTAAVDSGFKGGSKSIDAKAINGLRLGLKITNAGKTERTWKTAFPHLAGLQLSQQEANDYYLFPYYGGLIGNVSAGLNSCYGDQSAWWQMMDVFSPTGGAGLSLRVDDKTGLFKSASMQKSQSISTGASTPGSGNTAYMDPAMLWQRSLTPAPGTAMTYEYLRRTRAANKSFAPSEAVIEIHGGDWHVAMQHYADWAHQTWKWRPWPSKLHDVWNIVAPGWGQSPLFKDGKYRTDYINDKAEVSELMSWWEWSDKGPWRVPMDRLKEELGEEFFNAYKSYWVVDPATGQLKYTLNRGDYVGTYNKAWGGLPALREHIKNIRRGGQLAMLYTDPILADDNTELGHKYGPQYGVMNPYWKASGYSSEKMTPKGYVGSYGSWNMCADNAWYQDFLVKQMTQIAKDTGADGIRLDEYGHRGYTCFNPKHQHLFAEPGHNAWLQAIAVACEKIHAGLDKVKPDFILTAEFPGHDYLAKSLEGAIDYESANNTLPGLRPVPLNVFRFYFPEHKLYDLDHKHAPHGEEWRFWNASGAFAPIHPPRYHRILKENGDAFGIYKPEALVPTLAQYIYANRFTTPGKQITLLYNARGFTIDAPLLKATAKPNQHFFDLLNGRELTPRAGALKLKLRRDDAACIARLPRLLKATARGNGWDILVPGPLKNATVVLCAADGTALTSRPAATTVTFPAGARIVEDKTADGKLTTLNLQPAYVKLLRGKYLVDATQLAQ